MEQQLQLVSDLDIEIKRLQVCIVTLTLSDMEQQLQLVSDLDIEIKRLQVCNINPVYLTWSNNYN